MQDYMDRLDRRRRMAEQSAASYDPSVVRRAASAQAPGPAPTWNDGSDGSESTAQPRKVVGSAPPPAPPQYLGLMATLTGAAGGIGGGGGGGIGGSAALPRVGMHVAPRQPPPRPTASSAIAHMPSRAGAAGNTAAVTLANGPIVSSMLPPQSWADEKRAQAVRLAVVAIAAVALSLFLASTIVSAKTDPMAPAIRFGPISWDRVNGGSASERGGDIPEMAYVAGVGDDRLASQAFEDGAMGAMELVGASGVKAYSTEAAAARAERERKDSEEARRARWFAGTSTEADGEYAPKVGGAGGNRTAEGSDGDVDGDASEDARGNWGGVRGWEKRRGMEAAFASRQAAVLKRREATLAPPSPSESAKAHALIDKFYARMPPPDAPPGPQAPATHLDPHAKEVLDEAILSDDGTTQALFLGLPQGGGGLNLPETTKTVGPSGRLLCSALYAGDLCERVRRSPACVAGPFNGTWLTLHKGAPLMDMLYGNRELVSETQTAAGGGVPKDMGPLVVPNKAKPGSFKPAPDLEHALPPADFLQRQNTNPLPTALIHSCAVVGYRKGLEGANLQSRIDGHHLIARVNNAPRRNFEKHVGSMTTLRVTNAAWEGFREDEHGETVIAAKWCAGGPPCPRDALRRLGHKKTHALNPAFVEYVKSDYFTSKRAAAEKAVGINKPYVPSPAFLTVMMLLQVCHKVDVYGMAVFHESWGKLEKQGWKYYHDGNTPAPDEMQRDATSGKFVRNQTSLDTRDWTWDAADWFHRSRPLSPDGLTREHVADPAAAAEAAAEAAAAGTVGADGVGRYGGSGPMATGGVRLREPPPADATKNVGWGRRHLQALPKKKPAKPRSGFSAGLAKGSVGKSGDNSAMVESAQGGVMEQQCLRDLHMFGLISAVDASYDYMGGVEAEEYTKRRYKGKEQMPKHRLNAGRQKGGKKG